MAPKDDELPDPGERFTVSRRGFLKTTGLTSIAATVVGAAEAEAQAPAARAVGPGEVPVSLMVNGKRLDLGSNRA